jgi:hypothetical protein
MASDVIRTDHAAIGLDHPHVRRERPCRRQIAASGARP